MKLASIILVGVAFLALNACAFDVGSKKVARVAGSICVESDYLSFDCDANGVKVEALNSDEGVAE